MSCIIFSYGKLKNYSIKFSKNVCFFLFCLFCFLSLPSNTLHVLFYTYTYYWNTFQYKYIMQITFRIVKQSHAQVTSKDFVYSLSYYFFAYFNFASTSFYFMKLFPSLLFNWPLLFTCLIHALKAFFCYFSFKNNLTFPQSKQES